MKGDTKDWTDRHDLIIRIASPEVAAKKLGGTRAAVLARRQELGLPVYRLGRRRSKTAKRRWTADEDKLVRTKTIAEVVAKTGRTVGAVKTRRSTLKRRKGR